jgi:hypothetical protein
MKLLEYCPRFGNYRALFVIENNGYGLSTLQTSNVVKTLADKGKRVMEWKVILLMEQYSLICY